jgi:3-deoxy-D-manno-octulosonic acid kinase
MTEKTTGTGREAILYDDALLDHADAALFTPPASAASAPSVIGGRGSAWIVARPGAGWVLRHYRRGGLPGRFIRDLYLWTGLDATRPWREWRLLDSLYKEGLPVPRPVAARVTRAGPCYRGDLLTLRITGAHSLAELLSSQARDIPWRAVGGCLRRFHAAGVWHADLNAHNLLVDGEGRVHLIDFDRGARRVPARGWQQANLARLARSLEKLAPGSTGGDGWRALLDGHGGAG